MNRLKTRLLVTAAAIAVLGTSAQAAELVQKDDAPVTRTDSLAGLSVDSSSDSSETAETAAAEESSTEAESLAPDAQVRSKLTGCLVDAEVGTKRPMAIMLNNIYDACPQAGIEEAGIVYEAPVEGGLTRLMGIFEDYRGMEKIGSVRSCRDYYIDFAKEFDAVYIHYGQAVYAMNKLNAEGTDNISGLQYQDQAGAVSGYCGEDIFYRTSDRPAPHNVYISEEGIKTAMERNGYRTDYEDDFTGHYKFAADDETIVPDEGTATVIRPGYSVNKPWFEYNAEAGYYNRFQYGEAQIDQNTNDQLAVTNIIFQVCQWQNYDDHGYLNIDTQSGGDMYYFTKGGYEKGTWKKEDPENPDSRAVYYDADGNEITLNQGRTWVCIIQDSYEDNIVIE